MDPMTLIVTALTFGAAEMAKGAIAESGKEIYLGLKERIVGLFAGDKKAEEVFQDHEADPDTYEKPFKKALAQVMADKDAEVLRKAQELMNALDPAGSAKGRYSVTASGERSIAIGGSAYGNTIITGDNHKVSS